jgi:malate synthase
MTPTSEGSVPAGVTVRGRFDAHTNRVLTTEALAFVASLHRAFDGRRLELLRDRHRRQELLDAGGLLRFLPETAHIRSAAWHVAAPPADLADRRVEITGPVERKMLINALNSGANVFMADFEDATSPTFSNVIEGQANLSAAIAGDIEHVGPDGSLYRLHDRTATLIVRPRGWHLSEKHMLVDGVRVSASLFDFGLYVYHNAARLIANGSGPYFYLPKMESHLEARLWNDVFAHAEAALALPQRAIRATALIETVCAAFEMDEILFELRDRICGLNAGRWDYIFSVIKKFGDRPAFVLPDRAQIAMTVPFMRAYTDLLVKTCHRRRAHAIGGMAAFIPSRKDAAVNEIAFAKVREDKLREAGDGFDGTWVAHPDLVPVAKAVFDERLGDRPNQLDVARAEVAADPGRLLDVHIAAGSVTEAGLRANVRVGVQYLTSWLSGTGAAAIANLMEDVATAEISRAQVWQWVRHGVRLSDGRVIDGALVRAVADQEVGAERTQARLLFEEVALSKGFVEFLTLPGYELLD